MIPSVVKVGDIVGYVLAEGDFQGEIRPGIVVHVWSPETVQLQVFTDGDGSNSNDGLDNVIWKTSVSFNKDTSVRGTWHFLE